jgi:hypothetical protein
MNKIAVPLTLTASFLVILTAGIFTQTGFSGNSTDGSPGFICGLNKYLPLSAQPYRYETFCERVTWYENGTTIKHPPPTLKWCITYTIAYGFSDCIAYYKGIEKALSQPPPYYNEKDFADTTDNPNNTEVPRKMPGQSKFDDFTLLNNDTKPAEDLGGSQDEDDSKDTKIPDDLGGLNDEEEGPTTDPELPQPVK